MLNDFDVFDRKTLAFVQRDSSRSTTEIAELVGLSQAPCWRRLQRLKNAGYVRAQVVLLDRRKLGLNAQIFAQAKLAATDRSNLEDFTQAIREFQRCWNATC